MTQKQFAGAAPLAKLAGGITGTPGTFSVDNAAGYPDGTIGPFVVVVDRNSPTEEKILCTNRSGNTFTVQTRGFDGTASSNHQNGANVEHPVDADTIQEANSHVNNTTRDDHSQYFNQTRHANAAFHGPSVVVHGSTGALLNDDHTQYLRVDGGRAPTNHGVMYGNPVGLSTANGGGVSPLMAAADHTHKGGVIITTSSAVWTKVAGDYWYETDTDLYWYFDGTNKIPRGVGRNTHANVAAMPLKPGSLIFETDTKDLVMYDGVKARVIFDADAIPLFGAENPMFGVLPNPLPDFFHQYGTKTVTSDGSGLGNLVWKNAFPSGLLYVEAKLDFFGSVFPWNLAYGGNASVTGCGFQIINTTNGAAVGNQQFTYLYHAVGW